MMESRSHRPRTCTARGVAPASVAGAMTAAPVYAPLGVSLDRPCCGRRQRDAPVRQAATGLEYAVASIRDIGPDTVEAIAPKRNGPRQRCGGGFESRRTRPRSTGRRDAGRRPRATAAPCAIVAAMPDPIPISVRGDVDARAVGQLRRCAAAGDTVAAALWSDAHVGYSQPIGGVVAYRDHLSPSGVGYDIGCGNKAVLTNVSLADVQPELPRIMDEVFTRISFGVGRNDGRAGDHPVIDEIRDAAFAPQRQLRDLAAKQLGTVGAGNHYVDLFADEEDRVWIGVHFGSRGFGHKTASG